MLDLTVVTIVHNEEAVIEPMLQQARKLTGKVIVCDCSSTDKTVEIAKKYTDSVYLRPVTGSSGIGGYKQEILGMVTTPWVLYLDGDELLSDSLFDAINHRDVLRGDRQGWCMRRRWVIDGEDTDLFWPDYQLRFFDCYTKWNDGVHTPPMVRGVSAVLDIGWIIHRVSSPRLVERWAKYSEVQPSTKGFNDNTVQTIRAYLKHRDETRGVV